MKRKWVLLISLVSSAVFASDLKVDFKVDGVELPKAINLIYDQVLDKPYMLSPRLVEDKRLVSFKVTHKDDFNAFVKRYLTNLNVKIYTRNGVDYLDYVEPIQKRQSFVYTPIYQDADYLADFLRNNKEGENNSVSASKDKLVYYGTAEEIARVKSVLKQADTKSGEVVITGYVFEVQSKETEGSGINLIAKLLSAKLGISIGIKQNYENFITLNVGNVDAMLELFRNDTRFKVVSSPTLRVRSGKTGAFSVGSDVPTLSSVTHENGRTIQDVEYRSSGVIFNISPVVKRDLIDLNIEQQLSNFVKTDTGLNDTPTLVKRDLVTGVTVKSGDVIVLGGLASSKFNQIEMGFSFLPKGFFTSSSKTNEKSDIVILLQVKRL